MAPDDQAELVERLGAEGRRAFAALRMGIYEFMNAVWRVVDEELAASSTVPEARERIRRRLDEIRSRRT